MGVCRKGQVCMAGEWYRPWQLIGAVKAAVALRNRCWQKQQGLASDNTFILPCPGSHSQKTKTSHKLFPRMKMFFWGPPLGVLEEPWGSVTIVTEIPLCTEGVFFKDLLSFSLQNNFLSQSFIFIVVKCHKHLPCLTIFKCEIPFTVLL